MARIFVSSQYKFNITCKNNLNVICMMKMRMKYLEGQVPSCQDRLTLWLLHVGPQSVTMIQHHSNKEFMWFVIWVQCGCVSHKGARSGPLCRMMLNVKRSSIIRLSYFYFSLNENFLPVDGFILLIYNEEVKSAHQTWHCSCMMSLMVRYVTLFIFSTKCIVIFVVSSS